MGRKRLREVGGMPGVCSASGLLAEERIYGKHRTQVNQSVVQLTNERIRAMNRWSSCHAKLYKDTVLLIEAELKAEAQAIGKEEPKPKAKPKATAAPRPEGQQTPSGPSASDERPSRARTTEGLNTTMADHTAGATENTRAPGYGRDCGGTPPPDQETVPSSADHKGLARWEPRHRTRTAVRTA